MKVEKIVRVTGMRSGDEGREEATGCVVGEAGGGGRLRVPGPAQMFGAGRCHGPPESGARRHPLSVSEPSQREVTTSGNEGVRFREGTRK